MVGSFVINLLMWCIVLTYANNTTVEDVFKMAHILPQEQCDFISLQTKLPLTFPGISEYSFLSFFVILNID